MEIPFIVLVVLVALFTLTAMIWDLKTRRLPNGLNVSAFFLARHRRDSRAALRNRPTRKTRRLAGPDSGEDTAVSLGRLILGGERRPGEVVSGKTWRRLPYLATKIRRVV